MTLRLTLLVLVGLSSANAAPVSPCTPEMLDIQVFPPLEPTTVNQLRILVTELQNRSESDCQLRGPFVQVLPESGADSFTTSFWNEPELTPAEHQFQQNDFVLRPGEVAHALIAWNSRKWAFSAGCWNRDHLTLSLGLNAPSVLTVEHLWMHLCDRAYISRYRLGHYIGEPIATEWLNRLGAAPADFARLPIAQSQPSQPAIVVETRSEREMLHDYVELFLTLPPQDRGCPFLVLRKREANGLTKAYINHCDLASVEERAPAHAQNNKSTSRLNLPAMGLQPEKWGTVEYDVISGVPQDGRLAYAQARTSIKVRDPQYPRLPAIDSPSPECQASQLQPEKLPVLNAGKLHDALVYNVINVSTQVCRLGGVPLLSFSHPTDRSYSAIPAPCPNCADPLFQPRPSGWLDLKPQEAAHFIVGASRFPQDSGPWRQICDIVETIELKLAGEGQSLSLPFGVGTCAQINISAWRAGKYDGDPLNLFHERSATLAPQPELPKQCEAADFSQLGRPVIVKHEGGIAFGLSTSQSSFGFGDPIMLHLWIDNETDKEASVMSCSGLDFFWAEGFDLYDAYGHRLLKKNEIKDVQKHWHPSKEGSKYCLALWVCGAEGPIAVPRRTCTNGSAHQLPYYYDRNLAESYDLSPGVYYIVPAGSFDQNLCRETVPVLDPATLSDKLRITIEQN